MFQNILVVGSLNVDLVINAPVLPHLGETVSGSGFQTIPGGKGANQAAACGMLIQTPDSPPRVKMLGCTGNDSFGNLCVENLRQKGVDPSPILRVPGSTGAAVITVHNGDNAIILDAGANSAVTPALIQSRRDLFSWADYVVLQMEIPFESTVKAAAMAKEEGAFVILNPAPAAASLGEEKGLLSNTDLLVPNEYEAGIILDRRIESESDALEAVSGLCSLGPKQAVVTMGAKGCAYGDNQSAAFQAAYPVTAVDTTAAGDSFIGGLCARLRAGDSLSEAVAFATAVSAITVTRSGASSSLPSLAEVTAFLAAT